MLLNINRYLKVIPEAKLKCNKEYMNKAENKGKVICNMVKK